MPRSLAGLTAASSAFFFFFPLFKYLRSTAFEQQSKLYIRAAFYDLKVNGRQSRAKAAPCGTRAGSTPGRQTGLPSLSTAPGGGVGGSRSSGVIQRRPPNVLKHIHLPDFPGIRVWSGGCCAILPYKTHGGLLDLFLGRAGDWLGNRLAEHTHTTSP